MTWPTQYSKHNRILTFTKQNETNTGNLTLKKGVVIELLCLLK